MGWPREEAELEDSNPGQSDGESISGDTEIIDWDEDEATDDEVGRIVALKIPAKVLYIDAPTGAYRGRVLIPEGGVCCIVEIFVNIIEVCAVDA
jgi:hypothetical protein